MHAIYTEQAERVKVHKVIEPRRDGPREVTNKGRGGQVVGYQRSPVLEAVAFGRGEGAEPYRAREIVR